MPLRIAYIFLLFAGVLCIVLGVMFGANNDAQFAMYTLTLPGMALVLAGNTCMAILLYRLWARIGRFAPRFDPQRRVVDPTAALLLTVIPGVNFLGLYLSLGPLPGHVNWLARSAGVARAVSPSFGYVTAALYTLGVVPMVGLLPASVAMLVLVPILLFRCTAIVDAIEVRLAEPPVASATAGA